MKKLLTIAALLILALPLVAQNLQLTVEFPNTADVSAMKLYVSPVGEGYDAKEFTFSGNKFTAEVTVSQTGFYNLIGIKESTQLMVPVYSAQREGALTLRAEMAGRLFRIVGSKDNEALSQFNIGLSELSTKIWREGKDMSADDLRSLLGDYKTMLKKSDPDGKASQTVRQYLEIWSYTSTFNLVNSLPRILNTTAEQAPFTTSDVLPAPVDVLDSPLSALFPMAVDIVSQRIPKGTLAEMIDYVRSNYTTEDLRIKVEEGLLARYVSKYDYTQDFDGGLKQLQDLTDKYGLDAKFVEQFKKNRATVKGTPFPADVVLKDKDGKVVDFASFRGKYVYIDVWASWCGPCIQQIPHLQKLESELQNDKVVFISVSVDAKEEPWQKKMASLGVHGHQLWDSSNQLTKSLNISGIPFFLIYDSEGNLYMYDAPRPSQGEGLKQLLEGLGKN